MLILTNSSCFLAEFEVEEICLNLSLSGGKKLIIYIIYMFQSSTNIFQRKEIFTLPHGE